MQLDTANIISMQVEKFTAWKTRAEELETNLNILHASTTAFGNGLWYSYRTKQLYLGEYATSRWLDSMNMTNARIMFVIALGLLIGFIALGVHGAVMELDEPMWIIPVSLIGTLVMFVMNGVGISAMWDIAHTIPVNQLTFEEFTSKVNDLMPAMTAGEHHATNLLTTLQTVS